MSLYKFYENIVKEYKQKYNNNDIVIFIQVGSFYEVYDKGN